MLNRGTGTSLSERAAKLSLKSLSLVKRRLPTTTVVFDTYWRFAVERQEVLFRRARGESAPWTADPILATYKFTNAYRAADRVSQYLIRHVIYGRSYNERDTVFRVLLFKLFNKIETWRLLEEAHGELVADSFDTEAIDHTLSAALRGGAAIYSAAYIMPSGPADVRQPRKHQMHLELLARLLRDRLPERLVAAPSMAEAYSLLRSLPGVGPFLAYQFAIDLNYTSHLKFSEMEFVVPGPGARDGMKKCFENLGDYSEADAIRWVAEQQDDAFAVRGLQFPSLWGRPLQLVDCQNLFCEVDKYARVQHPDISGYSGRTRIKQRFSASQQPLTLWFPPKWGINDRTRPREQSATEGSLF
jgi:alpha-glutamyl/putrescinyl thymine pyrophosphorylase clade 1